jgi:hypothetical protein
MWFFRQKPDAERLADEAYARHTAANYWVQVLPCGWCLHLFPPGVRHDTFLARCGATQLFAGIDWRWRGWRLVCLRINHLPRADVIQAVEDAERRKGVPYR